MKALCLALVTLLVSVSSALVQGYAVEPRTAAESGWTPFQDYVSQTLTVNFDSLAGGYVELFAGARGGDDYRLQVFTYPGGSPISQLASGSYDRDYAWVRFDDIDVTSPESIVKGKRLEFRFTRTSGSDSIEYYY